MPSRARTNESELDDLLDDAQRSSAALMIRREGAREDATDALRALEQRMQEAIAGDTLRGLVDLAYDPTGASRPGMPFQAANIYGERRFGIDTVVPMNGKPTLVWTKDAVLAIVSRVGTRVESRPVEDDELTAQDLEPTVRAAHAALERHVARAAKTDATYARVAALAGALLEALDRAV